MGENITILYRNIQALCDIKRITVADLEARAGIPEGSLSNWKQERRWMVQLNSVAKELDVTIDDLFMPRQGCTLEKESLQSPMSKIISAFEKLEFDDEFADLCIDLVEFLLKREHRKRDLG